ncbi:alpha/beta hydrolase [Aquihabitans sp. G128]|uniref:alpha/beta hydrolase n=1 Tax=Aquihabitans sp. G128 TaxID=2849779 RepID=UPI001C24BA4C|nr:alpha/beta hydrolase [Aquihabitans sp. G128]QXC61416.1 alpha/beta hydrolase [Aquihabitans sp. G128]
MTDLIAAVPATLRAYTDAATRAGGLADDALDAYATAWSTFASATMVPARSVPASKDAAVRHLLLGLDSLDRQPLAFAEALERLDANHDGVLSTDDCTSAELVSLYVQERVKDPNASVDAILARATLVQRTGQELVTVIDPGVGRPRVVSLNLKALGPLEGVSPEDLQEILKAYGLTGENGGPVHFVVHGWTGSSDGAAKSTADLYAQQGVNNATVVAVDWDAGNGGDKPPGWVAVVSPLGWLAGMGADKADDFEDAEGQAKKVGDDLSKVFTALAQANPTANVAVTAHSLGNHVALRALTQMQDPYDPVTCQKIPFSVDYTGIEPAIPRTAPLLDPDHYGALVGPRIKHLSMSINNADKALLAYEARPWGDGSFDGEALGDEAADSQMITYITSIREQTGAGSTTIIDQNSSSGSGHLGIDPGKDDAGLVRSFYQEQIDRITDPTVHGTSPQTIARNYIHDQFPDGLDDRIFETKGIREYLDRCQEQHVAPTEADMARIAMEELQKDPGMVFD